MQAKWLFKAKRDKQISYAMKQSIDHCNITSASLPVLKLKVAGDARDETKGE